MRRNMLLYTHRDKSRTKVQKQKGLKIMTMANSTFSIVKINGKIFVKHIFYGKNFRDEDLMMVYSLKSNPYIKRLGRKMYIAGELLEELNNIAE